MKPREARALLIGAGTLLAIGIVGAIVQASHRFTFGGPDHRGLSRDPAKLLPSFARKLELLFEALRARNFDPMLNEGFRSFERAAALAKNAAAGGPRASANSMHCYGAAADIISASRLWDHPKFFEALGQESKRLGLVWGGDFGDRPHVQALPIEAQDGLRKLRGQDMARLDRYVARYLA